MIQFSEPRKLELMLKLAEKVHKEYEATLGHRDDYWAKWYANFLFQNYPGNWE